MRQPLIIIAILFAIVLSVVSAEEVQTSLERVHVLRATLDELLEDARSQQKDFDRRYEAELEKLERKAQNGANLDLVLAVQEEKRRFGTVGERPLSEHADLARLQEVYAQHSKEILEEQSEEINQLVAAYIESLGRLRNDLTKSGDIDGAVQVQEEIRRAERRPDLVGATSRGKEILIEVQIDEPSTIHLTKEGIYLENGMHSKPGMHGEVNHPTLVNGLPWRPTWGDPSSRTGKDKSALYRIPEMADNYEVRLIAVGEEPGAEGIQRRSPLKISADGRKVTVPDPERGSRWYRIAFKAR